MYKSFDGQRTIIIVFHSTVFVCLCLFVVCLGYTFIVLILVSIVLNHLFQQQMHVLSWHNDQFRYQTVAVHDLDNCLLMIQYVCELE